MLPTGHTLTVAPVTAFGFLPAAVVAKTSPPPANAVASPAVSRLASQALSHQQPAHAVAPLPAGTGSVVLDGTLGQTRQPAIGTNGDGQHDYGIDGAMGTEVGGNLFFSFSAFSLATRESATFSGAASVQNILARVTGGLPSAIDGTLRSTIPGATLYLINPAGVFFGPNARLDLSGSFVASTADYVRFADGRHFDSTPSAQDASLSALPVSAFGFLAANPAGVQFGGSTLRVPAGMGLQVVAGDLTLTSASLTAPGGSLTLFSAASASEVPLSAPATGATVPALGHIGLAGGSRVSIDGAGGGSLSLQAGQLSVDDSTISSSNAGGLRGGDVSIRAGALRVVDGGVIATSTTAAGRGGDLRIAADDLLVDGGNGRNSSVIRSQADAGTGDAGNLTLQSGTIVLSQGGFLSTSTLSGGNAGSIVISAHTLQASSTTGAGSGILTAARAGSTGHAGDLTLAVTGGVEIGSGCFLSTFTSASGHGGNLALTAGSLIIDGMGATAGLTGITSQSGAAATGAAGNVRIAVSGEVRLLAGGQISASTFSTGAGGQVLVGAGDLMIDGQIPDGQTAMIGTGIFNTSSASGPGGAGGALSVQVARALLIQYGGSIRSDTGSSGSGGLLTVHAGSLSIVGSGLGDSFTGIASRSLPGATGNAGRLEIDVDGTLRMSATGQISGTTFSPGRGADIRVTARSIDLSGSITGILSSSGEDSSGSGLGAGGDIQIVCGDLRLRQGARIAADAYSSAPGGQIAISCGTLTIDGAATTDFTGISDTTFAGGRAGDLRVAARKSATITGGGQVITDTSGAGRAGDLHFSAASLLMDTTSDPDDFTGISSESEQGATGAAGNLTVAVRHGLTLLGSAEITASTSSMGNGGTLTLSAGSLRIDGSANLADANSDYAGIFADSNASGPGGKAGDMVLRIAGHASLGANAEISAATFSSGQSGDIHLSAGSLTLDGTLAPDLVNGILAQSEQGATGAGGSIHLVVDGFLGVIGGAEISASTFSSGNGGTAEVRAGSILLAGNFSGIYSNSGATGGDPVSGNSGGVVIHCGSLAISSGARVAANAFSLGRAGSIAISAQSLSIDGQGLNEFTGVVAGTDGSGAGGRIRIAAGRLAILGDGQISTETSESGAGGDLIVISQALTIDGQASPGSFTGLTADSLASATGRAGNLSVTVTGVLRIASSGEITGSTYSSARGGNLAIDAGTLTIDGRGLPDTFTGITTDSNEGATGAAGNVTVRVPGALTLLGGGRISGSTHSTGHAGTVEVDAHTLTIDGGGTLSTGIFDTTEAPGRGGAAGDLTVQVDGLLRLAGRGQISAFTSSSGQGGNLTISAGALTIDGSAAPHSFTGLTTESFSPDPQRRVTGNAGNLSLSVAGALQIDGAGEINVDTFSAGNAGDLNIQAGSVGIDGAASHGSPTGIVAASNRAATGRAGNLSLQTTGSIVLLNGGLVSVSATNASAGNLSLSAGENLELHGGSAVTASAGADGGNITLSAGHLFWLDHSAVTATAGALHETGRLPGPAGQGGNITINPEFIVLDHGLISANAAAGRGGNIALVGQNYLSSESLITATGTQAGTIEIAAPELDLANALSGLTGSLLDVSTQLRERCARRLDQDFSSFLVLGQGGTEPAPEEAQASGPGEDEKKARERRARPSN